MHCEAEAEEPENIDADPPSAAADEEEAKEEALEVAVSATRGPMHTRTVN
jgi:hypothetical protein